MKRYQAVAFLLSTAMTVSSVAPVFGASNDVFGHWAELTITKWQNEGRIGGYEDGTFKPDKAITRAEFVRLLNSAAPTAFTASTSINFSDVKESDWFYADVAKAVGGRVASGFEDGTFRPGETVTRMQAAVFICNAKGLTPNEAAANNFTDAAQIPAWAKGAVGAAVAAGYLSGYPDGSFGGSKGMTRAEAVSTLDRVLGGGSTTTTPSGEIDTSDRDNSSTEDNRTAEAGNMIWTSGGGGGSSKKSSSSSSSSSDKKTNNVTIRSQKDADEYEGKTLTGTTTIYPDNGLELNDIKFKGDVDIKVQSDAVVASAYADSDVAVAAAYTAKINIYFEGKTSVSGTITVIENNIPSSQVVIRTRTPRKLSASVVAKVATRILGFELGKVEAQAPVEIAEGAKINTIEAGDGATVEVEESAEGVDKVDVTGDAKDIVLNGEGSTDVTVKDGATVENVKVNDNVAANIELKGDAAVTNAVEVSGNANADVKVNGDAKVENVVVSDSASADVAVADSANVGKIELKDEATAKIDVAPEAKVDEISSTSTGKTEVSGDGTVDKIEATDPSTVDTSNAGENVPEVDKKEDTTTPPTGGDSSTTATTIKGADLATLAIAKPEGAGAATITGVPEGVKASGTWAEKTAEPEVTPTAGGETTKAYSATITLEAAEAGKVVFDTAIAAADFKGVTDVTIVEGSVKATAEKVTFDVSAEVTEGGGDQETPAIKVSAPADVVVDTAAQTATVVDLSATLSNAGTIVDGTKMTWTAEATGITGDVKFGTDEATAETTGSSDITASNGETSIKMFVPAGEVGTIKVTAKCTVDEKEIAADPVEVKLAAKADENTVAEKLKAVEDGMKSDAASPKTVDLLVTDNATTIGEKVAEVAKTLVDGYDVTFAANDVTLDEETTTVTGKFTVQQSGNTDPSLAKTSASDITVKVAVKKAPIETVAISLTAPADGVAIANATTTGTGYAVKSTTWKEVGGANDMVTGDTFAAGAAYQATVVLEASTGYTFNAETAKTDVTGAKTTAINPAITADATELTLVVTYDALPDDGGDPEGTGIEITLGSDTGFTLNSAKDGITVASTATAKTVEALLAAVSVTVDGEADASATKKVYEIADDTDKTETEKTTGNLTTGWVLRVTSSADPTVTKDYAITVNGSDEGEAKEVTIAEGSGAGDAGITVSGTTTKEITIANVTTTPATLISNLTITVGGTALDNTSTVKVYGDTSGKANKEDEKTAALTEGTYWLCVPNGGADNATTDFKITVSDGNTEKTISLIEDITLDAAYIPEGGKVVPATAQEVTGTGYTATVTYEESKNTGNFADVDGTKYFKPSTAYVATVTITPDTTGGYSFADDFSGKVTVKLGSEDSTGTEVTLADGASGVKTGTATFAATEAASAAITTTPTDLTGTTTAKFEKTITIQLTGDAFKAVENDDTAIASLFEITDLPSGFTATVNQVSAGANEAVIKIVSDSETPSVLTKTSSITVKVLSTALISEKADLTITDGFTIEITQG